MPIIVTTTNNGFRYPTAVNNGIDFSTGIQDLASDIDVMWGKGTLATRPVAGVTNRVYHATDTGFSYYDTGSTWLLLSVGPSLYRSLPANATAALGDYIIAAPGVTVTLPASTPIAGMITIFAGSTVTSASPVTIMAAAGQTIYGFGPGLQGSSFTLGSGSTSVTLQALNSTQWLVIAGQQDTGWVPMTMSSGWLAYAGDPPACRKTGDRVYLRGTFQVVNVNAVNIATIPFPVVRPEQFVCANASAVGNSVWVVSLSGSTFQCGQIPPSNSYLRLPGGSSASL